MNDEPIMIAIYGLFHFKIRSCYCHTDHAYFHLRQFHLQIQFVKFDSITVYIDLMQMYIFFAYLGTGLLLPYSVACLNDI